MNAAATPPRGLAFVHIPKTGGTSITQVIQDRCLPIRVCNHAYAERLGDQEIVVLRDPLERFVSAFHYGRWRWPNAVNHSFDSPGQLAEAAADPADPLHVLAWTELGNRPEDFLARNGREVPCHTIAGRRTRFNWVYEPQSSWLIHSPRHVLRCEFLEQDFNVLLADHGLPTVKLPRLNSSETLLESTSDAAREFIERTYRDDFLALASLAVRA